MTSGLRLLKGKENKYDVNPLVGPYDSNYLTKRTSSVSSVQ